MLGALSLMLLLALGATLPAHLVNLIPGRPAFRLRDRAAGLMFYGHPFEHEVLDLERPESLRALGPDGKAIDLAPSLASEKVRGAEGRQVTRWAWNFEPALRGDFIISGTCRPRPWGEENGMVKDFVKAVIHVQAERGWDRLTGDPLEIEPLTRPYGIRPGSVYLGRALYEGKPLEGVMVEIEHANPEAPAKLPEEPFITRTVKSGPGGLFASTLDEAGWWSFTVSKAGGTLSQGGKDVPLTLRTTFWVYAGEPLEAGR